MQPNYEFLGFLDSPFIPFSHMLTNLILFTHIWILTMAARAEQLENRFRKLVGIPFYLGKPLE